MKLHLRYQIGLDILWAVVSILIGILITYSIIPFIDKQYYFILLIAISIAMWQFRWVVLPQSSFIINFLPVQMMVFVANFFIFFFSLKYYYHYLKQIEFYTTNFSPDFVSPILLNLDVDVILLIKKITILCFTCLFVLTILLQFRIMLLFMRWARAKFASNHQNY